MRDTIPPVTEAEIRPTPAAEEGSRSAIQGIRDQVNFAVPSSIYRHGPANSDI